jgi:hypothetical protein
MAQWGSNDASSNSVIWVSAQVNKSPNTANRDALYGNTTNSSYISGAAVGVFGISNNEIAASGGKHAHTGWVLRTVGSGGRAGRVFTEVLVAGGIAGDGDGLVIPN